MRAARLCCLLVAIVGCGDNVAVNQPPEVASFDLTTSEDLPVVVTLEAADPEGEALTVEVRDAAGHGTVTLSGLQITYTPADDYNGPDLFSLRVSDGETETIVAVDVSVTPLNDAPFGGPDSVAASEDTARVVTHDILLDNDGDVDGDPLVITAVSSFTNGTAVLGAADVTFTPAANFNGIGSFTYTLSDGTASVDVVVSVSIGSANDAPVAVDDTASTAEEASIDITNLLANDTDDDGNTLSVSAVSNATNGNVTLSGNTATFIPNVDFVGTATFQYTVTDGIANDTGLVTITVTNVNDAPVAVDDAGSTAEDTPITFANLTGNDTDVDTGTTLTVSAVGNATNGTVALNGGSPIFTPAADFNGTATFEYTVSDGTLDDIGLVTVTVTAANDAPVAVDDAGTTAEDTAVTFANLAGNDIDIDSGALTVTAVANATNGTVVLNGGSPIFTPTADFNGTATFQYTVSDGALTDVGLVTVTVTPVNDPPIAGDDTAAVQAGGSIDIPHATLLANDNDGGDGGPLTITLVQNAQNGTATLNAATVTFTPGPTFVGEASFDYTVNDGGATDTARVTVTVTSGAICGDGQIDAPEACDDGDQDPGDGCSDTCTEETGFTCAGEPSLCTPICGDGNPIGGEPCDDGNPDNTDGCTTECVVGVICNATTFPGGDAFAVDPDSGHCYVAFNDDLETFAAAQAACVNTGGYLATITSPGEQAAVTSVVTQNPWIGASEDANDTDAIFDWVTDEAFGPFTNYAANEPDDDVLFGGNGECLHITGTAGTWADTNCNISLFVVGKVCEYELNACGDSILQTSEGEECDDGGTLDGDNNCSATCQLEDGCGDGNVDPGEECDDDNLVNGDTCSSTCQFLGCGDGVVDAGEICDDGNRTDFDGCSATCAIGAGAVCSGTVPTTCSKLVINEVDYDNVGTDNLEFVEILNVGTASADVSSIALVLVNGANNLEYNRFALTIAAVPGNLLAPGGMIVLCPASATLPLGVFRINIVTDTVQNGAPDALGLFNTNTSTLGDALSYEGSITAGIINAVPGTFNFVEGTPTLLADSNTVNVSLQRSPNGRDTQNAATDFVLAAPSIGVANP